METAAVTTKIISGTYASGYTLESPTTVLSITATGYVGGSGVASPNGARHSYKIINDGVIAAAAYLVQDGVDLAGGGAVINGRETRSAAIISGFNGIEIGGRAGQVTNLGTIEGRYGQGVVLRAGGSVTNGASGDTTARIESYDAGVYMVSRAGTVNNFGTITTASTYGAQTAAILLRAGGGLTNGSNADTTALVSGYRAVAISGNDNTVANFGTIVGTNGSHFGVAIYGGGELINGGKADFRALIAGGVVTNGPIALSNFGRIVGYGRYNGVTAQSGSTITNGSSIAIHALIQGFSGVEVDNGPATVTNFGTIWGRGGYAVEFDGNPDSSSDVLAVEAGSAFVGQCVGGGGALLLASGTGTIASAAGTFSPTGGITVSGSIPTHVFTKFATVEVGAAGVFRTPSTVAVATGETLEAAGSFTMTAGGTSIVNAGLLETTGAGLLVVTGALANTGTILADGGTLTVTGAVTGVGAVTVGNGRLDLAAAGAAKVTFIGSAGVLELGDSQGFTGTVAGFSKSGKTSLDLDDIAFVNAGEATFSGTQTGGVLTVTDGTHTARISLTGDFRNTAFMASDDGHGGVGVIASASLLAAATHRFIAAAAGLPAAAGGANVHHFEGGDHERSLAIPRAAQA